MTRAAIIIADLVADHGYRFCCWAMLVTNATIAAALMRGWLA